MKLSELFFGSSGQVFALANSTVILIIMLIVAFRLSFTRRRKAYLSLTLSLALIVIQHLILIAMNQNTGPGMQYGTQVLQTFAFILINMGIFQLYNASTKREYLLFYSFLITTALISGLRFYVVQQAKNPPLHFIQLQNLWIEIFLLLLIFLSFYLISPYIGQRFKYNFGLIVYTIVQLSRMIHVYLLKGEMSFLIFVENFLPLVYYITLFLILFERVVELLQAVYASSIKDGLTGLYNRRYLINRIEQFVRQKEKVSIIFGDIDNFKRLNDTHGHQAGDLLLKKVAKIVMEESEGIGIAGRFGGEELVIVLTDTSLRVENLAETIRRRVEKESAGVTISLGFSKYRKGATAAELIAQADKAMYEAKKSGKNKIIGYAGQQRQL